MNSNEVFHVEQHTKSIRHSALPESIYPRKRDGHLDRPLNFAISTARFNYLVAGLAAAVAAFRGERPASRGHSPASAGVAPASRASPSASGRCGAVDEFLPPSDPLSAIHPYSRHPIELSWIRECSSSPFFAHPSGSVLASRDAFFLRAALALQEPPDSDLAPEAAKSFVRGSFPAQKSAPVIRRQWRFVSSNYSSSWRFLIPGWRSFFVLSYNPHRARM